MKWRGRRQSRNVEDRRGRRIPRAVGVGGGGLGLLVIILLAFVFGVDPTPLLDAGAGTSLPGSASNWSEPSSRTNPAEDERAAFVSTVLADTEEVWGQLFAEAGQHYEPPRLVLFTASVRSACGMAQAATGPFYCPGDRKVYIDLSFFDELQQRFRAPGDFAQAYVITHEIGHHIQTLAGTSQQVHAQRGRLSQREYNRLSVRLELQADCLAGVWAHHAEQRFSILEPGDIEEALGAASAIGDDRIQRSAQGRVVPDAFTHGTSAQRVRWFSRGLDSGTYAACDTFGGGAI